MAHNWLNARQCLCIKWLLRIEAGSGDMYTQDRTHSSDLDYTPIPATNTLSQLDLSSALVIDV